MSTREILQTEIWSKQTTQKIWLGIGSIAAGVVVFSLLTRYWISPMEKRAGREALVSIEALKAGNDTQFDVLNKQAKEKVETAHQESLTVRDQQVALGLFIYLSRIEQNKMEQTERSSSDVRLRAFARPKDPNIEQVLGQVHDQVGRNLHRLLD